MDGAEGWMEERDGCIHPEEEYGKNRFPCFGLLVLFKRYLYEIVKRNG
jgi:hypothetical protein